jgi:hypothetical protein
MISPIALRALTPDSLNNPLESGYDAIGQSRRGNSQGVHTCSTARTLFRDHREAQEEGEADRRAFSLRSPQSEIHCQFTRSDLEKLRVDLLSEGAQMCH